MYLCIFSFSDVPYERRVNKCAYTYQDLIPRVMPNKTEDVRYLRKFDTESTANAGQEIYVWTTILNFGVYIYV
jgi:hypothetical protein